MKPLYITLLALGLAATAQAQTVIDFDSEDYQNISVYDSWAGSPFREDTVSHESRLKGNAQIVDNFLKERFDSVVGRVIDASDKIVGFQRSRYGSNLYGLRIDLKTPIRVTSANQYIHVMTYMPQKPSPSKMMVIGLGKHIDDNWKWQSGEDEQFWALSVSDVEAADRWQDQVFSFTGFTYSDSIEADRGIDILSLVIIPDVASRSDMAEDFVCYFDSIVVDNNPAKRFSTDYYPVSFDTKATPSRDDRVLNGVGISVNGSTQTAGGMGSLSYNNCVGTTVFNVKPGDVVTPKFTYKGGWMSGYAYVDWGKDGVFSDALNEDGTPAEGSDVVSYNGLQLNGSWKKSDGSSVANGNTIGQAMPAFTVPKDASGFYRMRFKVDWNSIDPAGNSNSNNMICANGGGIVDVILNVQTDERVTVSQGQLNGDIVSGDGTVLNNYQAPAQQDFVIQAKPAAQFHIGTLTVKYGFNTGQTEQFDKYGNPKYLTHEYKSTAFDKEDKLTIPAALMIGNSVKFEAYYVQGSKPTQGDTLKTLADLDAKKTYLIVNKSGGGYLCYDETVSEENLSITGITGDASATHGFPVGNEAAKASYTADLNVFSPNVSWTITKNDEGAYLLYNVGKKGYAFRNTEGDDVRTYKFSNEPVALTGIKSNAGFTYSFLSGDATYTDGSTNFLCISSKNYPNPVVQWTWNDAGSEFFIISNPNVEPEGTVTGIRDLVRVKINDDHIYDISGRRLNGKPAGGLYIQGGKKYVMK